MAIVLRLLAVFAGIGLTYLVAGTIVRLSQPLKFVMETALMLSLMYFIMWSNIWISRRYDEAEEKSQLAPSFPGHALMFLGALVAAYGLSFHNKILLVPAIILYMIGEHLLNPGPKDAPAATPSGPGGLPMDALLNAINEQRKTDPLVGAKIGGKEVYQRLLAGMKNERGVHIESLLCALGALAGYSCQASVRAQSVAKGLPETKDLIVVDTTIGKKYFFGDPLNHPLAEAEYSVWGIAGGAAQENECQQLPDVNGIFSHVAGSVGQASFGIPRLPEGHGTSDSPINFLKVPWPVVFPIAKPFCQQPSEWPILFALAIREAILASKGVLAPDLALLIVMESAIPMSKVDLSTA